MRVNGISRATAIKRDGKKVIVKNKYVDEEKDEKAIAVKMNIKVCSSLRMIGENVLKVY